MHRGRGRERRRGEEENMRNWGAWLVWESGCLSCLVFTTLLFSLLGNLLTACGQNTWTTFQRSEPRIYFTLYLNTARLLSWSKRVHQCFDFEKKHCIALFTPLCQLIRFLFLPIPRHNIMLQLYLQPIAVVESTRCYLISFCGAAVHASFVLL